MKNDVARRRSKCVLRRVFKQRRKTRVSGCVDVLGDEPLSFAQFCVLGGMRQNTVLSHRSVRSVQRPCSALHQ